MTSTISTKTKITSGFANILAIFSAVLNGISGLLLVLLYTIIALPGFIGAQAWDTFFLALLIALVINYIILGIILYSPLQELLNYATKLALSFLLSLISIATILILTMHETYTTLQPYAVLSTAIFVIEAFILYFLSSLRSKKLALVLRHKQSLDQLSALTSNLTEHIKDKKLYQQLVRASAQAFTTWGLILRSELVERWDLSKVFNRSILLAMAFFLVSSSLELPISGGMFALSVGLIAFLSMIVLIAYDLVKSQKIRWKLG